MGVGTCIDKDYKNSMKAKNTYILWTVSGKM